MRPHAIRCFGYALALLLIAGQAVAMDLAALPGATADAMAQAASPQAIAEYRRKVAEYKQARADFEQDAVAYWSSIAEKRRGRNAKRREQRTIGFEDYVLTQPPVYSGPARPANPEPSPAEPEPTRRERKYIPVVADLLKAARQHFQYAPQRPASQDEFKRDYASAASAGARTRYSAGRHTPFEPRCNRRHEIKAGRTASDRMSRVIQS